MTVMEYSQTIEAGVRSKNKKIVLDSIISLYCTSADFLVEGKIQKILAIEIGVLYQQTVEEVDQCIHLQNFL